MAADKAINKARGAGHHHNTHMHPVIASLTQPDRVDATRRDYVEIPDNDGVMQRIEVCTDQTPNRSLLSPLCQ